MAAVSNTLAFLAVCHFHWLQPSLLFTAAGSNTLHRQWTESVLAAVLLNDTQWEKILTFLFAFFTPNFLDHIVIS